MDISRSSSRLTLGIALALSISLGACKSPSEPEKYPEVGAVRTANMSAADNQLIAQMRAATAKYHNIDVARNDGYVDDGFGCIADPALGGMGWHLIRDDLHADPSIDPLMPELLIYEPGKNGKMKLVAVEYEVYQQDWIDAGHVDPPSLLGREFEALVFEGIPPVYGLHVWLWENNKAGLLEDWNPKVKCPAT